MSPPPTYLQTHTHTHSHMELHLTERQNGISGNKYIVCLLLHFYRSCPYSVTPVSDSVCCQPAFGAVALHSDWLSPLCVVNLFVKGLTRVTQTQGKQVGN